MVFTIIFLSCNESKTDKDIEKYKKEIFITEKKFESMLEKEGWSAAFYSFADSNAVINQGTKILVGKESIKRYYQNRKNDHDVLKWTPDFIDVSSSGDLGYSYGKFTFISTDSIGNKIKKNGYFHTVWKRQKDGSLKYVWD